MRIEAIGEMIGGRGKSRLAPLMLTRLLPAPVDQALGVVAEMMLAAIYVTVLLPVYVVLGVFIAAAIYVRCAGVMLMR